jgi:hypothetical protein
MRKERIVWDQHILADVRRSPQWQPWAAQGWELRLAKEKGRIIAVHEGQKKATAALSGLRTVLDWLAGGKPDYYQYLKNK